ncbi:MAG: hypothetical protein ACWGQW_02690 [bacterium]
MPRALERPARLVTLRLFDDDMEYLKLTYSRGYNQIVRALVARHVRKLKVKTVENLEKEALSEEELESV